jgi:hypothetical protein
LGCAFGSALVSSANVGYIAVASVAHRPVDGVPIAVDHVVVVLLTLFAVDPVADRPLSACGYFT